MDRNASVAITQILLQLGKRGINHFSWGKKSIECEIVIWRYTFIYLQRCAHFKPWRTLLQVCRHMQAYNKPCQKLFDSADCSGWQVKCHLITRNSNLKLYCYNMGIKITNKNKWHSPITICP